MKKNIILKTFVLFVYCLSVLATSFPNTNKEVTICSIVDENSDYPINRF